MIRNCARQFVVVTLIALCGCAFTASAAVKLYWTSTDGTGAHLVRADADGSNPVNIVSGDANIKGPNGLEAAHGLLYWPDQQLGAIRQVNADGTGVATVTAASNPYDVFGSTTQIYWTSQSRHYIDRQHTNGTGYQRLFDSASVTAPFAVDVTATHIYWSEVSGQGSIRRADLNGANIVTLVANVTVYDLQVTTDYIYFADINFPGGALKRANLDGTGVISLVSGAFGGVDLINGICVTTNAIYWSEYNVFSGGGIRRANLDGTGRVDLYNAAPNTGIRGVVLLEAAVPVVTPPPQLGNPTIGSGGFTFALQGEAGRAYRIESSGNLTNWTELTNFVSMGTTVPMTNAITPGTAKLFFRARTP